jgi:hypothetical protein
MQNTKNHKHTIYLTTQQKQTFETLKKYDIKINAFIILAISEKIKRDWKQIKEQKQKVYIPF